MPHLAEHVKDNRYTLMSVDMIQSVNSTNKEFSKNMRKSYQLFRSSSIASESFAKESLKDVFTKLDNLLMGSSKDGYNLPAPEHFVVTYAKNWIKKLFLEVDKLGLLWVNPHIATNADGEVVFEWWYGTRKLTIYIEDECAEYIQVWGNDMNSAISDGDANTSMICRSLWIWLLS